MTQQTNPKNTRNDILKIVLIVGGATLAICLLCVLIEVGTSASFFISAFTAPTSTPFPITSAYATQIMDIHQSADLPARLNFPRYVDVDQQGTIYIGNAGDGNVLIFDPGGNFQQAIPFLKEGSTMNGIAVTPDGHIFVSADGNIQRLNSQGDAEILPIDSAIAGTVKELIMDQDGSLLATDEAGDILRIAQDGTSTVVVAAAFQTYLDEHESWFGISVDTSGNIYALGGFTCMVLKFSPDGEYLGQFGGENRHHVVQNFDDPSTVIPAMDPGYFYDPMAIAVDAYGRIFVSDSTYNVQILDSNGAYLHTIKTPDVMHWLTFDSSNNLYTTSDEPAVLKLSVKEP